MRKFLRFCGAVTALGIGLNMAGAAPAHEETSEESPLLALFSYYLKDGGLWRQGNADHEAGDGSPVAYLKHYRWGPGEKVVLDDTYALMEDGSCLWWTHNIFSWDQQADAVKGEIFHRAGFTFAGHVRKADAFTRTAEMQGILPDGTEIRMRDVTDTSDPGKVVIKASMWDGEAWQERDAVSWEQISGEEYPCRP